MIGYANSASATLAVSTHKLIENVINIKRMYAQNRSKLGKQDTDFASLTHLLVIGFL